MKKLKNMEEVEKNLKKIKTLNYMNQNTYHIIKIYIIKI